MLGLIKNFVKLIFFSLLFFCLSASQVFAASFYWAAQNKNISLNQTFEVILLFDSANESINAIAGEVLFDFTLLKLKEVNDGNSVISFWVKKPILEKPGQLSFAGIVPGGYQGTKAKIFSIIFEPLKTGSGKIEISSAQALRNDGLGSPASVATTTFKFFINQGSATADLIYGLANETDPPEIFKPEIVKLPSGPAGKYFLVFVSQDKGSGIDHYEVKEGSVGAWKVAESPYLLANQKLNDDIYVKAVDRNGNERVVTVKSYQPFKNWLIFLLSAIILVIGAISLYSYRRLKHK